MNEDIKIKFGKKIQEIRKGKKLSQEMLADLAKLHRTYISDIERGNKNVSLENIKKLSDALGVDMYLLFK